MQLFSLSHPWQVSPKEAIEIQKKLSLQVTSEALTTEIRFVAGLDAAFSPDGKNCIAAVILWDMRTKIVVEQHIAIEPVRFPYIPGLLSFREGEALLKALSHLKQKPDVIMCDGQGIAHPRYFGIACHIGVLSNIPSLGCGKSRLCGEYTPPEKNRGAKAKLSYQGKMIGTVLCTKNNTKPLFVSIGHKMDLASAEKIVLSCDSGYRLPEPTRRADKLVAQVKREKF